MTLGAIGNARAASEGIKVLHVIPSISAAHGGPSRAIAVMEKSLCRRGAVVTTVTTDDDGPGRRLSQSERPAGARRRNSNSYVRKWTEFYKVAPGIVPWLWRNIRNFDVVHVHALFSFTSIAAGSIAWLRKVPYIIHPIGTLSTYGVRYRRPWLKRLSVALIEGPNLRAAAAVHFTSEAEREEAAALGLSFRGVVIPLGVEDEGARAARSREGRPNILFLSRLAPIKNVEALIDAFAACPPLRAAARLRIAGSGAPGYVEALQARARAAGLVDDVEWLGHVEGAGKAAAFADADIFVLPSFSENFGIAAVEAMLAGLPCVLGEGVGIARNVSEAGAGLVTTPIPHQWPTRSAGCWTTPIFVMA